MSVKITIIGLGQIGGSIGLALAQYKDKISVVGHDKETAVERAAQKKGAVEKTEHNLPKAVQNARIIILALPVHQMRETLELIAPDLLQGAIVVDTSPIKCGVTKWAREILPDGCSYIGLVPTIGSDFLHDTETGLDSAKADLFSKSIFMLDAPAGTTGEAVQLVIDLVKLVGATAMLTDSVESDGLMTSVHLLPQLVSAALLNATIDQPGWHEGRKLAGRAYAAVTSALITQDDPDSLRILSLHNPENVVRSLDVMIAALHGLRNAIQQDDDEALKDHLQTAYDSRETWMNERSDANWEGLPGTSEKTSSLSERLLGLLDSRTKK